MWSPKINYTSELTGKTKTDKQRMNLWFPVGEMEKATAPHSSTLAWKIPWTEDPGRLQSMGSLRVGHD